MSTDLLETRDEEITPAQWALVAFGVTALLGVVLIVVKLSAISVGVFLVGAIGAAAMTFQHWRIHVVAGAAQANQWVSDTLAERSEARAAAKAYRGDAGPPPARTVPRDTQPPVDPETGDRVYWTGRPSFFRMRPFHTLVTLLAAAAGLGFVLGAFTGGGGRGWKFAAGLFFLGVSFIDWFRAMLVVRGARYTVAGKRASMRLGLLSKSTIETRHKDVRSVEVDQSLMQRVFGCGTVRISSAAGPGDEVVFFGIAHPQAVASLLRRLQDAS